MNTITEQARAFVDELAKGSSLNAVAKKLEISQQSLHRFMTKEGAALSLKNYEKIVTYMNQWRNDAQN